MTAQYWQPTAQIEILKRRARLLADVRLFFSQRGVLEVETPVLSHAAPTAPYLDSFSTDFHPPGAAAEQCFLQTSPEFAMKRLLAAGSGDIFQVARVFRNGESGRLHSPEFTMLEWYRPSLGYTGLMDEVDEFMQRVAGSPPARRLAYRALFADMLQIDCLNADEPALRQCALSRIPGLPLDWRADRDGWLEMLMSAVIEPHLARLNVPVIVYDFPPEQAQLACLREDESGNPVAARFELYAGGMELANGYDELRDAGELRQRFERDNVRRVQAGRAQMPLDEHLLSAMTAGLPSCSGVALGIDRLLMLVTGRQSLQEVVAFAFDRS